MFFANNAGLGALGPALTALLSNNIPDPVKGATHYHTKGVVPAWSKGLTPIREIGYHLFFNNVP